MNEEGTIQVPFSKGSWMPDRDPARIGAENFSAMENVKYTDSSPIGVSGYELVNFVPVGFSAFYPAASGDDGYSAGGFSASSNGVSIGSPTALPSWTAYFDNTKWEPTGPYGTWDGSEWDSYRDTDTGPEPYDRQVVSLAPIGLWVAGYRPTKIKITHGYAGGDLELSLSSSSEKVAESTTCTSGTEYDITNNNDDDISSLDIRHGNGLPAFSITNIEFFA